MTIFEVFYDLFTYVFPPYILTMYGDFIDFAVFFLVIMLLFGFVFFIFRLVRRLVGIRK